MDIKKHNVDFSSAGQLAPQDMAQLAELGFRSVINNRPDGEADGQPTWQELEVAAKQAGLSYHYLPVVPNQMTPELIQQFADLYRQVDHPTLAFCRTGNRSTQIWEASQRLTNGIPAQASTTEDQQPKKHSQIVIVGGGAAGIATAASLLKRDRDFDITIIEPRDTHYYQPGWTFVGSGVFKPAATRRPMEQVMPSGVEWIQDAVTGFEPDKNTVQLTSGVKISYDVLVVAPGLKLDWQQVKGLEETLGENGVASNYDIKTAQKMWENTQSLIKGRAVFTQPPMPIKCAGAPQKAMYLASDYWQKHNRLGNIQVEFYNAGKVLFGVPDYVPALQHYVAQYHIDLHFSHNLVEVDGPAKKAWFANSETNERIEVAYDLLHVSPPQTAPDFIRDSSLVNAEGWVEVDQYSLRHTRFANIFSLGDVCSAPNAKTAAAVRKQAPVVAHNIHALLNNLDTTAYYDGYGSCPLIVERGKVVLAEFGYGGKLLPSAPVWLLDGKKPTRLGWLLKAKLLPSIYFDLMLRGHEWLATPLIQNQQTDLATKEKGA